MRWRLLDSGYPEAGQSGARNMAIDEAVLSAIEAGRSPPTLRVYGWSPACISLGHSQSAERELDLVRVRESGYGVVMRPTGGRAVLHIDELTYSVLAAPDSEAWCGSQAESYRFISEAVAKALAAEGLGVALDRGYPVEKPQALRAMTPCFSSTARSEVVWDGRKLVGSAQRRLRGAFLQHGSILLSPAHRGLVDCLKLDAEKRARYLEILDRNAVCLQEALGREMSWSRMAEGFTVRFAKALGLEWGVGGLSEEEEGKAAELSEEKARYAERLLGIACGAGYPGMHP